ncbi:MAG: class I SAM-dependent methyltransferase [Cyclobacteriaceae bacterium]
MSHTHQAKAMLRHWLLATDRHSLHEPFAYNLYQNVIIDQDTDPDFSSIEQIRSSYALKRQKLDLQVLGAASKQGKRSLRQLALYGSTRPTYARMLYRLTRFMEVSNVIELGTSLGLTSLYLSNDPGVKLLTLEGDPILIAQAKQQFEGMKRKNITIIGGNIDETFDEALHFSGSVDMIYFDANHRYEPTKHYFEKAKDYIHENSVLVFDDIHWSPEMTRAWNMIKNDRDVTMTVDLYQMGFVFFRPFRRKYNYLLEQRG